MEDQISSMSLLCNGVDNSVTDWSFFMLLLLPPEIIYKILQCLPLADRKAASRVCRMLYEIEAKGKYYDFFDYTFTIIDQSLCRGYRTHGKMVLSESSENYVNAMKKIFRNTFFVEIYFHINNRYGDLLKFVAEAAAEIIIIHIEDIALRNELSIETIDGLMKGRVVTRFWNSLQCITSTFLLNVYQRMQSETDELMIAEFVDVCPSVVTGLLASIGVRFIAEAKFSSTNKNIQVLWADGRKTKYIIAIGNIAIFLDDKILDSQEPGKLYIQNQNLNDIDEDMGLCLDGSGLDLTIEALEDAGDVYDMDVDYV